jgi:hypothetical protein
MSFKNPLKIVRYFNDYRVIKEARRNNYGIPQFEFECPNCKRVIISTVKDMHSGKRLCKCTKKKKVKKRVYDVKAIRRMAKFSTPNNVCKKFNLTKKEFYDII